MPRYSKTDTYEYVSDENYSVFIGG